MMLRRPAFLDPASPRLGPASSKFRVLAGNDGLHPTAQALIVYRPRKAPTIPSISDGVREARLIDSKRWCTDHHRLERSQSESLASCDGKDGTSMPHEASDLKIGDPRHHVQRNAHSIGVVLQRIRLPTPDVDQLETRGPCDSERFQAPFHVTSSADGQQIRTLGALLELVPSQPLLIGRNLRPLARIDGMP